jgi:DNA invertase Pin-like site-specific DNA recombinase
MARYSGGVITHRALTGPRRLGWNTKDPELWKGEVLTTLKAVKEIRSKCDMTEMATVREARKIGVSWTEIAETLSVTRQSAWERWRELDEESQAAADKDVQR